MTLSLEQLSQHAVRIATLAGEAIMKYFEQGDYEEFNKDDESPVTSADYAANEVVLAELMKLTPDVPIISEEVDKLIYSERKNWPRYWLVDPLDGTQEFVAGRQDFAVNIALVENNEPVLGVVYSPATKVVYWAVKGLGTHKLADGKTERVTSKKINPQHPHLRVAVSRVQTLDTITRYIKPNVELEFISLGSCALKCCLIAEGGADLYIRIGPTGEWDTGAPQIIVEEAGGCIIDSEFVALSYNERESLLNPNFMVTSDAEFNWPGVIIPHSSRRD